MRPDSLLVAWWLFATGVLSAQDPSLEEVVERLKAEKSLPAAQRVEAVQMLGWFPEKEVQRVVLSLWSGLDEAERKAPEATELRHALIALLGRSASAGALKILKTQWAEPATTDGELYTIGYGLMNQGSSGFRVLGEALAEAGKPRDVALWVLRYSVDPERAAATLFEGLEDAKPEEQAVFLEPLRHYPVDAKLRRWLGKHLDHADPDARAHVLALCASDQKSMTGDALDALTVALTDDEMRATAQRQARLAAVLSSAWTKRERGERAAMILELIGARPGMLAQELALLSGTTGLAAAQELDGFLFATDDATARAFWMQVLAGWIASPHDGVWEALDETLSKALDHRDVEVRLEALRRVSADAVPDRFDRLMDLLPQCPVELRSELLVEFRGADEGAESEQRTRWQAVLRGWLVDAEVPLNLQLLDVLAELGDRDVLERAWELLGSSDWREVSGAAEFCGRVPHRDSVPRLIEAFGNAQRRRLQADLQRVLARLTGKSYGKADYWQRWWESSGASFELPERVVEASGSERAAAAEGVLTYYGMPIESERIVFVVDVSGSMAEQANTKGDTRLDLAKQALLQVIARLTPTTSVDLVAFSDDARSWVGGLEPVDDDTRADFERFVTGLTAGGGTNVHDAMRDALAVADVDTVYLLSDGQPSVGEITEPDLLARQIAKWNLERRARIHTIAIGMDSDFLREVAERSGGDAASR